MILSDTTNLENGLIQQAHFAYKGNSRYPASGTDKYLKYKAIANRLIRQWARDPIAKWGSLWNEMDFDDVIAVGTQSYAFDTTVLRASDRVYITDGAGGPKIAEYKIVKPQERDVHGIGVCYITGPPLALFLNFNDEIKTGDRIVGETIQVAGYVMPDALDATTDVVPVDNPDWLVYALAAELARNDPAKETQFPNLIGLANEEYRKMLDNNILSPYDQSNAADVRMPKMGESW